jgi:transcriptional regulator with XRE-family HTH domain
MNQQWLEEIEKGNVNPTWGNMRRLAKAMGVRFPELCALAEHYEKLPDNGSSAAQRKKAS